VTKILMVVPIL